MTAAAAVAAVAVLVTLAVLFVAWPFVSPERERPEQRAVATTTAAGWRCAERRDAAYGSLRDLEQDLRTGKVTEADYEAERDRLRAEAARVLRELDELR